MDSDGFNKLGIRFMAPHPLFHVRLLRKGVVGTYVYHVQVYKQLISNKPELEELVWKVQEGWQTSDSAGSGGGGQSISPVNKYIHQARGGGDQSKQ